MRTFKEVGNKQAEEQQSIRTEGILEGKNLESCSWYSEETIVKGVR